MMINYLFRSRTVSGTYYVELIRKLRETIKEKRRAKLAQVVLLHHDSAAAYTSNVVMAKIHECEFELLCHLPYSPDLASSDFHVFRFLKELLLERVFGSDEVVIQAINE